MMATNKIFFALASALLLATSCDHYDVGMHTTVNEDGSCSREFRISVQQKEGGDSIAKRTLRFDDFTDSVAMRFGNDWKTSWTMKGDSTENTFPIKDTVLPRDTFMVTARQDFESVEAMTADMPLLYNERPYAVKGELKKSFKWFCTDYTYTETYRSLASNYKIPISNYVAKDTASYWFTGSPDIMQGKCGNEVCAELKDVEMKVSQWIMANLISDACDVIAWHYDVLKGAPMSKEKFVAQRNALIKYADEHFFELWESQNFQVKLFRDYFDTDVYADAIDENKGGVIKQELDDLQMKKYGVTMRVSLDYTLTMPGRIIDAGCGKVQDGMAHYKLGPEMFGIGDYTISATSRVTNVWAYIVSVLIILIAIGSFWYKKR